MKKYFVSVCAFASLILNVSGTASAGDWACRIVANPNGDYGYYWDCTGDDPDPYPNP